jgi:cyanophycin synthetase
MIKLAQLALYSGPNPYSRDPVGCFLLTFDPSRPENTLMEGARRVRDGWPSWFDGQYEREPDESPWLFVAWTAVHWALAALNEVRGDLHAAGVRETARGVELWLGFHHPPLTGRALELALQVISTAARPNFTPARVKEPLERLWELCRRYHPDYQARILMQGARALDLPVTPAWGVPRHWMFGWGAQSRVMFESSTSGDSHLGARLVASKPAGKAVLTSFGFPTPQHVLVQDRSELAGAAEKIGWPCVVKPMDRGGGKGVTTGIVDINSLEAGFKHAKRYSNKPLMVEECIPGDDHRLTVVDGRLIAAIRREPPSVVGDGISTVDQLVKVCNHNRSPHNLAASGYHRPVVLDGPVLQHLAGQGLGPELIPAVGRRITLRGNANLSTGGVCIDVTDRLHPHVRRMAETIACSLRLTVVGIDYLTTDIGRSWGEVGGAVIEVNITPGIDVMIAAGRDAVDVAAAVLGNGLGRIPLTLLVVPDAELKPVLQRLENEALGAGQGWVCDGRACLEGMHLKRPSPSPWAEVRTLLGHRTLESALLVCGGREIQKHGLPVDKVSLALLCRDALPPEWQQVVEDTATHLETAESWPQLWERFVIAMLLHRSFGPDRG